MLSPALLRRSHSAITQRVIRASFEASQSSDERCFATIDGDPRSLITQASLKVPNSTHHLKVWRAYSHSHYRQVERLLRHSLGADVELASSRRLEADLGRVGANTGVMPDFSNSGALAGYALNHFGRARLLGDVVVGGQPDWMRLRVEEILSGGGAEGPCHVASLGGGPGYDYVALSALSEFRRGRDVHAVVYEYEPRWGNIVGAIEEAVAFACGTDRHECGFQLCDITLPLDASVNKSIANGLHSIDVVVCSYCVAENAVRLSESDFCFFRDLFAEVVDGTLFLFTDTTHRLWPDLADAAIDAGLRVSFPHMSGSGKAGWQLILLKDGTGGDFRHAIDAHDMQLYSRFRKHNDAHLDRLRRGWKRDQRKIRGVKQ
jgi:hypothetical protein